MNKFQLSGRAMPDVWAGRDYDLSGKGMIQSSIHPNKALRKPVQTREDHHE